MTSPLRDRPVIYHIPVCPFSQRVEILLELKGLRGAVDFHVVDITKPREPWLLELTRGTTALPVMQDEAGRVVAWVVRDGRVERRAVRTGASRNGETLVVSGLQGGERLVRNAPAEIADGTAVRERGG